MKLQVLVFALAAVVVARASIDADPVTSDSKDIDVQMAYKTHLAVIQLQNISAPYLYSFGYESFNETTGDTSGQYENCYKDVAVGTYFRVSSGGNQTTVDYTVTHPKGYRATVRRDVHTEPVTHGYGRLAGPQAYASTPAPTDTPWTLVEDEGAAEATGPEVLSAFLTHGNVMTHNQLRSPYRITWGYQFKDPKTGRVTSQYEEYKGDDAQGRLVFLDEKETQTSITTKINVTGFYVTKPVIETIQNQ